MQFSVKTNEKYVDFYMIIDMPKVNISWRCSDVQKNNGLFKGMEAQ